MTEKNLVNCGISRWDDPEEINQKLRRLQQEPIWEVSDTYYENQILRYYREKCKRSHEIYTEAKKYIPGGVQHNLAFNVPFPLAFRKAEGAWLEDEDGNKYIDFMPPGRPTILGSNYEPIKEAAEQLIDERGPVTGLLSEPELLIAREIHKHMPAVEMFRMLGSGTESVMAALRIARIATKHKRVIKIGGAYHGWSDQMVYGLKIPGTRQFLESHGIPSGAYKTTDEVRPNDLEMLEQMLKINRLRGGTAAVIVEPVGPESGTRPIAFDYNQGVRDLCTRYGALMIFDEVVTGFRVAISGAQGYFGVEPDLTIFGKIVAGGYPGAGGVGGKKEYAGIMAAGLGNKGHKAYVGGTLAANPLSALAGYMAIQEIERTNACEIAGRAGDRLCDGLKDLLDKYGLPFVAYNQGSIVHLECTAAMSFDFSSMFLPASLINVLKKKEMMYQRKDSMERMGAAYMANGIVTLAGSRLYTSMADTDEIIDEALNRFENVFRNVVRTEKCAASAATLKAEAERTARKSEKKKPQKEKTSKKAAPAKAQAARMVHPGTGGEIKAQVVKGGHLLCREGYIARTWGNVSARIDADHFAITPSGRDYRGLSPEDIVVLDLETLDYEGDIKPSGERQVHREIYKARPEAGFIIHTHQHNASAVAAMGLEQIHLDREYPGIGNTIPCAAYGLPGTKKLSDAVGQALESSSGKAILMSNHGAICYGADLEEAMETVRVLEEACGDLLEAMGIRPWRGTDGLYPIHWRTDRISAYLDDFAQMFGPSLDLRDYDPVKIAVKHGEAVEAVRMVVEKNCRAGQAAILAKGHPLSRRDCLLMRAVYKKKYSGLKDE